MEAHELRRGALFKYVLRLRPDAAPSTKLASILHPVTKRLHVENDDRVCHDEDKSGMMPRWLSPFYFSTYRNFEYCYAQQQPIVNQVCKGKMYEGFVNSNGVKGVSFTHRRCSCDFRMHINRFGLVWSWSEACMSTFSFQLIRGEPQLPIRSTEHSILRDSSDGVKTRSNVSTQTLV
eukprot:6674861-Pyramimonas_sp.AAC.1